MKFSKIEILPTTILAVDFSDEFSESEISEITNYIDKIIAEGKILKVSPDTPRYQTYAILFQNECPLIFQKLRDSFLFSCNLYLEKIEHFFRQSNRIVIREAQSWAYRSNNDTNGDNINPWHSHHPAFLSGVFYLKFPKEHYSSIGSEFNNPISLPLGLANNTIVNNNILSWSIFPSYLPHRAVQINTDSNRYVIAADAYVSLE